MSFNGAALFTGRREITVVVTGYNRRPPRRKRLQWGRPFYGAESKEPIFSSIDPETLELQWGRPFYGAESVHVQRRWCFHRR